MRALRQEEFALVLLDVRMPAMDGFETASAIRTADSGRSIPIIHRWAREQGFQREQIALDVVDD